MEYLQNVIGWQFMSEPLWRWFMFWGALVAIGIAWGGILEFMK